MPNLTFNNASDAATPDDVRINSAAVRFVEASRHDQNGLTTIYMLGQVAVGIPVAEPVEQVVGAIGGLAAATRHYLAGAPGGRPSSVYICPANAGYLRPNRKFKPPFPCRELYSRTIERSIVSIFQWHMRLKRIRISNGK